MSRYDEFNAVLAKRGWTFDPMDEVWRDKNGQMLDPKKVRRALPGASWDELASWAESMRAPVGRD